MTLSSNAITACVAPLAPPVVQPPTVAKAFNPASITVGGVSRLTITLSNANAAATDLTAAFTDTLPVGVLVAPVPALATTCGGAAAAPVGGPTVTLANGSTIPAAGFCTIGVNVTAATAGAYLNTIPAGALQTTAGNNLNPASAVLTTSALPACVTSPTITTIPSQVMAVSGSAAAGFTISGAVISDALVVTATSSDLALVPQSGMVITKGIGGARVLTITGADGRSGVATITVTATDPTASNCATSTTFQLTIGTAVPALPPWAFLLLTVLLGAAGAAALRTQRGRLTRL